MGERVAMAMDVRLMNITAQLLLVLAALLALGWVARWVAYQPLFVIRGITVLGDVKHNNAATLRINALPYLKGGFFDLDLNQARAVFEAVPWVRKAVVRRVFPNRLRVELEEQKVVAYWGHEGELRLVNAWGEVFEANIGEVEQEDLPRLLGPPEQAAQILAMYQWLRPQFAAAGLKLQFLELSNQGSWKAALGKRAWVQLGSGSQADVQARTGRFLRTLSQVLSRYQRTVNDLEAADLRHDNAYALRLRGVTTQVAAHAS
jgi:cell division protein FtsQ